MLIGAMVSLALSFGRPQGRPNDPRAEEDVRRANAAEVTAFLKNDPKALAALWSDEFVVTNPLNRFVNKRDVLGMVENGTLQMSKFERKIEYVRVYGTTVIVAGSEDVVWGGKMPLAGKPSHLRFTAIWMNEGGRWLQVARHANIVQP
jgi:hypothetical protein